MPSFAFWKSTKPDETRISLLSNDAAAVEEGDIELFVPKNLDLDPGNDDSGIFLFDDEDNSELPISEHTLRTGSATQTSAEFQPIPVTQDALQSALTNEPASPNQLPTNNAAIVSSSACLAAAIIENATLDSSVEESEISFSDSQNIIPESQPPSIASSNDVRSLSRPSLFLSRNASSTKSSPSCQRTNSASSLRQHTDSVAHRLCRPAELNLGLSTAADTSKPRTELEKRYEVIRNSKTQSKAALRSPTDLLQDRLNMSRKKIEERVRIFTPPKPLINGCLLPGPGAQMETFTSTSVRAQTEAGGRPAWWCKFDKLVVFDGIETQADGELKIHTRTSKGLTIARRRGDMESIVIPMDCVHCQEMLNRNEWKYDMRVCKRSVCWDCKERCKWEFEEEKRKLGKVKMTGVEQKTDANRYRADSVLQDEQGMV
ncbi:hypothetical protein P153DRAFT_329091 [Dothidotthia symphoricarpi CBS 119687]|uniref:Uncharacterized protein n=1 Tax=Dothidotthia symphoricarpi CBS 119687 TaxID=1392245 RepID=A0A6A6AVP3_9PLEO|nr:uncharacterized protein P153DRAFT_329091 [Dothidotthia symphoricarpi CBS 119687]KAF2134601.1 hypothetical protein P153DRAFT_329091 [Dothidotthia symphoricarpi CBS 119687]